MRKNIFENIYQKRKKKHKKYINCKIHNFKVYFSLSRLPKNDKSITESTPT